MSTRINDPLQLIPGNVVGVWVLPILHVGIVSDYHGFSGLPYVISDSVRAGHGAEEPWEVFSAGRTVYRVDTLKSTLPWPVVLTRARYLLPKKWNLFDWNCEHFVREALGIKFESPQLQYAVLVGVGTLFFGLVLSKKGR